MQDLHFEQKTCDVRDFRIRYDRDEKSNVAVTALNFNGEDLKPTKRFWRSFFQRFRISENVFRYFEPTEVFTRISQRAENHRIRFCIERRPDAAPKLLAATTPGRPMIAFKEVKELVDDYEGQDVEYSNGVIISTHMPRSGGSRFRIGGDDFEHRFLMETPVDGFGHPRIHLSFLRMVCTNGMVGYSKAFRSDISLGKDIRHCIVRALESYDNGEGYAALRQRFESAQSSWASIRECLQLYQAISRVQLDGGRKPYKMLEDFRQMTGNLHMLYGLANLDAISTKRQRILPAKCRIYDLLNFASEVGTHYATAEGNKTMQAFVGGLISDEYDMEGTAESTEEFSDFFLRPTDDGAGPFSAN